MSDFSQCLSGRDRKQRGNKKNPSEYNMNPPLMTVNTVCGRSREIASPNALRYRFSWSRLESSCSLEKEISQEYETSIWSMEQHSVQKVADLAVMVRRGLMP